MPLIDPSAPGSRAYRPPKPKPKPKPKRTVRVKAHPHVEVHVHVHPSPDAQDAARAVERRNAPAHPSPDAQDVTRSPAMKRRDKQAVARNVKESRRKVVVRNRRQAVKRVLTGGAGKSGRIVDASAQFTAAQRKSREQQTARIAPVLKVLDQTTRPLHAVAGAADVAVNTIQHKGLKSYVVHGTHGQARKAASRGIQNKDRTTFSKVLKDAGVHNKTVQTLGGLGLDIVADPLTYTTGGTGSIAEKAALKTARKAAKVTPTAKRVAAAGSKEEKRAAARAAGGGAHTPTLAERAVIRGRRTGDQTKGVTIKFAGKEVPGVRRATAVASKPVRKAARKATPNRLRVQARGIADDLNPNITPPLASREASKAAIMATRTARAKASHGLHVAQEEGVGLAKRISQEDEQKVLDAIEAQDYSGLSPELQKLAKQRVRDKFKYVNRIRRRAGIRGGTRANYVPHYLTDETLVQIGKKPRKSDIGRRVVRPASSKFRKRKGTLADLRTTHPGQYREDLPGVYAQRMSEGHAAEARGELNRALADNSGRTLQKGKPVVLKPGEAVYRLRGADLQEVPAAKAAKALRPLRMAKRNVLGPDGEPLRGPTGKLVKETYMKGGSKGKPARYVAINKDIVDRALQGAAPELRGKGIVHVYDRTQGGFKRLAIATPGFHIRNIVGDTMNAYLGQSGHHLPGNFARAARTLKAYGRQEKGFRNLTPAQVGKATLPTKVYGKITYDEAAKELRNHGAFRSGYISKELPELAGSGRNVAKVSTNRFRRSRPAQFIKRQVLAREDLPRLVTAMEALRHGATYQEAAEAVSKLHFDYQHLTDFERQFMRRALPFYTWNARNIPLQAEKLITHPGKYANFQKVREEAANASHPGQVDPQTRELYRQLEKSGVKMRGGWEKYLTEYEQRNAGIPISWKGHKFTVSAGFPLQDLNELPGVAGPKEYFDKGMSLVTPIAKDPTELAFNYSFFFRDQIERDTSPMVAAPAYVGKFPDAQKRKLHIAKIRDKKSGKMVWGWPGRVDYVAHIPPGIPNYAQQFATPGHDRRGKGFAGKALGFAGVRSIPIDPVKNAIDLAYARQRDIRKELSALRQQGVNKDNPTPQWRKLNDQLKVTTQIAYQGKAKAKYAVLPTQGGPSRRVLSTPKITLGSGGDTSDVTLGSGADTSDVTLNSGG